MSLEQAGNINQAAPNLLKMTETCLLPAQPPLVPQCYRDSVGGQRSWGSINLWPPGLDRNRQIFLWSTNLGRLTYLV